MKAFIYIYNKKVFSIKSRKRGSSHHGSAEMNLTSNHEKADLIPGLAQWVNDPSFLWAPRCSSDLALLWLWHRLVATAPILWGAKTIQGTKEGSLPEQCNSKDKLLIRKRGLSEQCNSEGRFLNKEISACKVQYWGQSQEDNKGHLLTSVGNWIFQETILISCCWVRIVPWMT